MTQNVKVVILGVALTLSLVLGTVVTMRGPGREVETIEPTAGVSVAFGTRRDLNTLKRLQEELETEGVHSSIAESRSLALVVDEQDGRLATAILSTIRARNKDYKVITVPPSAK